MPLAAIAGIGLAGSIGGALIGSDAASNAASDQSQAAEQAAQLQYKASQDSLAFQKQQWQQEQANLAPWLNTGAGALSNLSYLLGIGANGSGAPGATGSGSSLLGMQRPNGGPITGGNGAQGGSPLGIARPTAAAAPSTGRFNPQVAGLSQFGATSGGSMMQPYGGATTLNASPNTSLGAYGSLMQSYPGGQFTAPTAAQAEATPGYQFARDQGQQAIQRSAAASGGLLTGGTMQALDQYTQGLADTNYQNAYSNALNSYDTNFNVWNQNQANQFNRLAALAGVGQTAAGQLGTFGQNASNSISNNLMGTAAGMGQAYQNAAAANASGYVGSANAWSGALNNGTSNLSNLLLLNQLGGLGGSTGAGQTMAPYGG